MLLVAMADGAFSHVLLNELVAVLDHVRELALGDQRQALAHHQHDQQRQDEDQDHVAHVLRDADAVAEVDHEDRVERVLQMNCIFR